jgi:hypothetical protein
MTGLLGEKGTVIGSRIGRESRDRANLEHAPFAAYKAFSGKVETGFPSENATDN